MKKQQNGSDVVGLITKMQEQLAALDKKLDSLISRCSPQSSGGGQGPRPPSQPPKHDHAQGRPMYQATCADCKKDCEIPFKPSGDRPVYCQECFRRRKAMNTHKPMPDNKPKAVSPPETIVSASSALPVPAPKDKKKSSLAKKPAPKKKPALKKKK